MSKSLNHGDYKNLLLPHTENFLTRKLKRTKAEIISFTEVRVNNPDYNRLENQKNECIKSLRKEIHQPVEQKEIVTLGSGVKVKINGITNYFFVDCFNAGNGKNIASLDSKLGKELFKKKVNQTGSYYTAANHLVEFEILEILPYSKAVKIIIPMEEVLELV